MTRRESIRLAVGGAVGVAIAPVAALLPTPICQCLFCRVGRQYRAGWKIATYDGFEWYMDQDFSQKDQV